MITKISLNKQIDKFASKGMSYVCDTSTLTLLLFLLENTLIAFSVQRR